MCRGCKQYKPLAEFAQNQALDFSCKAKRDNLQRIAKRQKMLDWFTEMEADDDKLSIMLGNYEERCPLDTATGIRTRGKIVCAVLKQVVEAATEVLRDDIGEMMCEPEYLEWSKTPRGGMLDPMQAKRRWDDMVELGREIRGPGVPAPGRWGEMAARGGKVHKNELKH